MQRTFYGGTYQATVRFIIMTRKWAKGSLGFELVIIKIFIKGLLEEK